MAALFAVLAGQSTAGLAAVFAASDEGHSAAYLSSFPSFFDRADQDTEARNQAGTSYQSGGTVVFSDPVNGRIFEVKPGYENTISDNACKETADANPFSTTTNRQQAPSQWAEYTSEGKLLADRCGLPGADIFSAGNVTEAGGVPSAAIADSSDRLVFVPNAHPLGFVAGPSSLAVIAESDLHEVADICIDPLLADYSASPGEALACQPPTLASYGATSGSAFPQPHIVGLSWSDSTRDLTVLTDSRGNPASSIGSQFQPPSHGPLVVVSDFQVHVDDAGAVSLAHRWSYAVSSTTCTSGLYNNPVIAGAAIRTQGAKEDAVFIPCVENLELGPDDVTTSQQFAVVKVVLGARCGTEPDQYACPGPTPLVQAAASPVAFAGMLLDPVSERGFLPVSQGAGTGAGVPVLVYEGAGTPTFSTHVVVGKAGSSSRAMEWGLDTVRGRFYALDLTTDGYGLTMIDSRRTPLGIGTQLPDVHPKMGGLGNQVVVMPPDRGHDATWIILPWYTDFVTSGNVVGSRIRQMTVLGDRIPVTSDPAIPDVDHGNTDNTSPTPQGASVDRSFAGGVGGYAAHVTLVGGYGAALRNLQDAGGNFAGVVQRNDMERNLSGSDKQISVFSANVDQLTLANGSAQGAAAVLNDGNGDASHQYAACSQAATPQSCQPPHCPVQFNTTSPRMDPCYAAYSAAVPSAFEGPISSGQTWPSPLATCSNPGPEDSLRATKTGLYYASPQSTSSQATPSPTPLPGTDASPAGEKSVDPNGGARAHVDCAANDSVEGDAWTPSLATDFGTAGVTVGSGYASASVAPPGDALGSPILSQVTAEVRNIDIRLGSDQTGGELRIGEVQQVASSFAGGRTGTAGTSRTVLLGDMEFVDPQGGHHRFCAGGGSEFAAQASGCPIGSDALQQALAALNQIAPTRFAVLAPQPGAPFGLQADGAPKGSPGGYAAQVAATPAEQFGDEQFNGMTSTQASYLPALRLVVYQDSTSEVAREVIDLAGVETDVHQGVQFDGGTDTTTPPPAVVTIQDAAGAAGVNTSELRTIVQNRGNNTNNNLEATASGPLAVIQRVLAGLDWLRRSPAEALEMGGLLALFGMPLLFMARRRSWASNLLGEDQ
jgi:hypothetical protein